MNVGYTRAARLVDQLAEHRIVGPVRGQQVARGAHGRHPGRRVPRRARRGVTRVAVLGDTHLPRRARDLPPSAWRVIDSADLVIHTGDVTDGALLARISERRPLHAVRGNNDLDLADLPDELLLDIDDIRVAVVHDSGAGAATPRAAARGAGPTRASPSSGTATSRCATTTATCCC